MNSSII